MSTAHARGRGRVRSRQHLQKNRPSGPPALGFHRTYDCRRPTSPSSVHTRRLPTVHLAQLCTVVAMPGRIHNCGARLPRLLGVLTVVAGVFAMHGLTSHHDAAMAVPGTSMVVTE